MRVKAEKSYLVEDELVALLVIAQHIESKAAWFGPCERGVTFDCCGEIVETIRYNFHGNNECDCKIISDVVWCCVRYDTRTFVTWQMVFLCCNQYSYSAGERHTSLKCVGDDCADHQRFRDVCYAQEPCRGTWVGHFSDCLRWFDRV